MKHLKSFNDPESYKSMAMNEIQEICKRWQSNGRIDVYKINDDESVDIMGDVNISHKKLTSLPFKFGRVTGYFKCDDNWLKSLEGCPNYVGGNFNCNDNFIKSLEGCPNYIGGDLKFRKNEVRTFDGFPKHINNTNIFFDCWSNPVYEIFQYFSDYTKIEFFNDCDIIRGDKNDTIVLDRLNYFLKEIGKKRSVTQVKGYTCI